MKRLARGGDGCGYFLFAMGGAQEGRFKLRRRQPHSAFEHGAVKAGKGRGVGLAGLLVIGNGTLSKKPRPHGADAVKRERDTCLASFSGDAIGNGGRDGFELWIDAGGVGLEEHRG